MEVCTREGHQISELLHDNENIVRKATSDNANELSLKRLAPDEGPSRRIQNLQLEKRTGNVTNRKRAF